MLVKQNPVLGALMARVTPRFDDSYPCAREDWAWVTSDGHLYANSHRRATPGEWAYVVARCLLHLGLGHIREERENDFLWNAACDCVAAGYLADFHIGTVPGELDFPLPSGARDEEKLPENMAMWELLKDRENLENTFQTIVRGMAYPFGTYNDTVVECLKKAGLVYGRTTISSHSFDIPGTAFCRERRRI